MWFAAAQVQGIERMLPVLMSYRTAVSSTAPAEPPTHTKADAVLPSDAEVDRWARLTSCR